MGKLSGMMLEFSFLTFAMGAFCGPFYMLNLMATFGLYLKYTKDKNTERIPIIRDKKNNEKD